MKYCFFRCQCNDCTPMQKGRESLCCKEVPQIRTQTRDLPCVTAHKGFEAMCLNPHIVEAVIYRYVDEEQGGYIYGTPACEYVQLSSLGTHFVLLLSLEFSCVGKCRGIHEAEIIFYSSVKIYLPRPRPEWKTLLNGRTHEKKLPKYFVV